METYFDVRIAFSEIKSTRDDGERSVPLKLYHCSFAKMVLALNYPCRLICY